MEVPSFSLKALGRFDSRLVIPYDTCTTNRVVDQYEFDIFLTDQPGVCYVDDVAYSLTAGTVIFARPGQTRRSILPFQCNYIYIKTQDPSLVRMLNALPNCLYTEDVDGLVEMFQDPDVISDKYNPNRVLLRHGYACKFLHRLMQLQTVGEKTAVLVEQPHRDTLLVVCEYIKSHLAEPFNLDGLAKMANLSPIYFHRLFTEYFGLTPNRYITQLRIKAAKAALAYSDTPLAQIAVDCGFSSQPYFTVRFQKETGITPLQYRKQMQARVKP